MHGACPTHLERDRVFKSADTIDISDAITAIGILSMTTATMAVTMVMCNLSGAALLCGGFVCPALCQISSESGNLCCGS